MQAYNQMKKKTKHTIKRWKDDHPTKLKIRVLGNEVFIVHVSSDMTVSELRKLVELSTGIPYDLQRLTYLDQAELEDTSTLKDNEIVPGGAVELSVWHMWLDLVEYAIMGEISAILKLGISASIPFSSPITDYMDDQTKLAWLRKRAFVVLCIAVHRENIALCEEILPFVKSVNTRTPHGRTALHIAASQGKKEILKFLLEKGFKIHAKDKDEMKPIDLAVLFNRADAERLLFMTAWKEIRQRNTTSQQKKKELIKPSKKEEPSYEDVSELTSESRVTVPVTTLAADAEEVRRTLTKMLSLQTMEVYATAPPQSKEFMKKEEVKDFALDKEGAKANAVSAEDETKAAKVHMLRSDGGLPAGYSRDPDSFRHYLLNLKKKSTHFGYAASMIDDHLQRLDDVRYQSFHRNVLVSEHNG